VILPDFDVLQDEIDAVTRSIEKLSECLHPTPKENRETKKLPTKAERRADEKQRRSMQKAQRLAPRCIICMGLPGSGKSTFANTLAKLLPPENSWLVINQDRLGRKKLRETRGKLQKGPSDDTGSM
jgi:predicted ATPase with chaperone activity